MTSEAQATMEKTKPAALWGYVLVLGVLALTGLVLCASLMKAYWGTDTSLMRSQWFCGSRTIETYGCSGVFASRFGKWFGIPLPAFGEAYFGAVLVWLLLFRQRTFNILFALLLAAGLLASMGMLFVLFFILPGQCRWCLSVHLINGLMILTGVIALIRHRGLYDVRDFGFMLTKACLVMCIILAATGWLMAMAWGIETGKLSKQYEALRLSEPYQQALYTSQKPRTMQVQADDHVLGSRSAPVKIFVYQDYQCEACLEAWALVRGIVDKANKENQQRVCLVVRHYPLSDRCNRTVKIDAHPYACSAAQAVEAASVAGGEKAFWTYHELLHKHHSDLDKNPYLALAQQTGISDSDFRAALADPKITRKIERDTTSLHNLGFQTTPAIFVNGRFIDGWKLSGFIEGVVQKELDSSASGTIQNADEKRP